MSKFKNMLLQQTSYIYKFLCLERYITWFSGDICVVWGSDHLVVYVLMRMAAFSPPHSPYRVETVRFIVYFG